MPLHSNLNIPLVIFYRSILNGSQYFTIKYQWSGIQGNTNINNIVTSPSMCYKLWML
jgi:hypothetical protein